MSDNNNSSVPSINENQQIILDGKATAASIKEDLKARVARLRDAGVPVGLGTVLVGEDPGSLKYVAGKHKDCTEVGIDSIRIDLPESASQEEVLDAVLGLNENPDCTGYIIQLPLPKHINQTEVISAIDPDKDADGLHPVNLGELVLHPHGDPGVPEPCTPKGIITLLRRYGIDLDGKKDADGLHPVNLGELVLHPHGDPGVPEPCTPKGIITLLRRYGIDLDGKNVCVIGRGVTVGRTIGLLLTRSDVNATVDLCHTGTVDLKDHVRRADVIVSCAGSAGLIKPDWLGDGADHNGVVLVDVGVSRKIDPETGKSRIRGDFDRDCWTDPRVRAYTPNPGGVGPMTRVMLLENVVDMAERRL